MSLTVAPRPYRGVFPVVPTTFDASGALDLESQLRAIDYVIDSGAAGMCILANYSEQFSLDDAERELLTTRILAHVAGRLPVIVTTSHYSTRIAAERSRRAAEAGAAMVMLMPPYHGATLRVAESGVREFLARVADASDLPIMVQDAPVSGTPLSATFLAALAREIPQVRYFKIEVAEAAAKLRHLLELGGSAIEGPFDGEECITLLADLDAGASGSMPSAMVPDLLAEAVSAFQQGDREGAVRAYERVLPLINFENKQCGLRATKTLMFEGGIIACEIARHPFPPLHPTTRAGLLELARRLDPLILRWAR
jgi:dihydrodipicolinate synthase/N-acetylneuraminate lyase